MLVLRGKIFDWKGRVEGQSQGGVKGYGKGVVKGYGKKVVVCHDGGRGILLLRGRIWWRVLVLRGRIVLRLGEHKVDQGHEMKHLLGGGRRSVEWGRLVVA